jgi:integrase
MGKTSGIEGAMARTLNRLSAFKVEKAKKAGMYCDGGGLYLRVADGGSKQWIYRYVTNGRPRDMGIGPVHVLTLAEAREKARDAAKLRLEGIDPIAAKHTQRAAAAVAAASAMTFRQCAEGFIKDNEASWSNHKHRLEWQRSLAKYAFPVLGNLPVAAIDTPLVLKVVKPLWQRVPETASRVRGRIENVLGWATVHHYRNGDNPARWQGHMEHALPTVMKGEHFAAMPYAEVSAFMTKLREQTSVPARCLEFAVLTAARLGEALHATWDEINLDSGIWTVPASRMKGGKEHRVPLSRAALAVLKDMQATRQSDYVFPGAHEGKAIGKNMPLRLLNEITGTGATVHGFRSSFRDWAAERTSFPREVAEMALAHAIPDAVEAAYRRGDLFEKRRKLMDAWAAYSAKVETDAGKVVALARARTPR